MTVPVLASVEPLTNALGAASVGSPEWWLRRLHTEIVNRQPRIELHDAYYRGEHPLPWLPSQARQEFRRILTMTRSNYMGLVVDATAERLQVEGFRLEGSERADADTWRLWQANNLDADSDKAMLESLICETAYMLVEPNGTDTPGIFVEHPSQAIVAYEPGSNRRQRVAALKLWVDDWTALLNATLFLREWVYKFQAPNPKGQIQPKSLQWERRAVRDESWPARNVLGVPPMVELPNNPRLLTGGVSELADVVDIQDRINKTVADRLMTQDFGAFPAIFASGYPDDGDEPVQIGRDRMVTTDVQETKWWQMTPAPLDPYSAAKREDVKDIASRTRTPAQYLLGEMSNVNGETLKAAESGLVAKVRQRMRSFAEGFEETLRLARVAADLPPAGPGMETIWRNPEFRTEGETTDAAIKRVQAGLSDIRQGREDVGYSATQIENMERRESELDPVAARIAREFQAGIAGAPAASNG